MPDIKKIEVDGELYDIKDETARNCIGDMGMLDTKADESLVDAINEVRSAAMSSGTKATVEEETLIL